MLFYVRDTHFYNKQKQFVATNPVCLCGQNRKLAEDLHVETSQLHPADSKTALQETCVSEFVSFFLPSVTSAIWRGVQHWLLTNKYIIVRVRCSIMSHSSNCVGE